MANATATPNGVYKSGSQRRALAPLTPKQPIALVTNTTALTFSFPVRNSCRLAPSKTVGVP